MMVWWGAFWIFVVVGLIWLVFKGVTGTTVMDDSPEAVLKRRYARGDLNQQEYEQRLDDLRK